MPAFSTHHISKAFCAAFRRVGFAAAVLSTLSAPEDLQAQPPAAKDTSRQLRPADLVACDQGARLLTLTLVDAKTSAPVNEASVVLLRQNGDTTHRGHRLASREGVWVMAEEGESLLDEARVGLPVTLLVRRAGRADTRRRLTLRLDSRGCHLELSGPATLRV